MPDDPTNKELLEKLTEISAHLQNLDRRDRNRTAWSWMRSIVAVAMFVVALYGSWYFINNLGEIMKLAMQESAKQTQQMMKNGSEGFLQQVQGMFGVGGGASSSSSSRARPRPRT